MTGATGTAGRAVVGELLAAGQPVHAAVRDVHDAELPPGVVPTRFDFTDPTTAAPALDGVDRLFLMRPPAISEVRTTLGPLIDAARRRGLRQVVVLSVMGVNPVMPHWRMERMVRDAGLASIALRPAYFSQNLLTAFGDQIRERSQLRLAAGAGRLSWIDARDVAAVAARVLTDPQRCGRLDQHPLTLTGPQALTFGDAAALLSTELDRPVSYHAQGLLEHRRELRSAGLDPTYIRVQLIIDITTRLGLASKVTTDVADVLGQRPRSLAAFVNDYGDCWR